MFHTVCDCAHRNMQVRHRNMQETLLVHVDVRPDASGVLLISLSHQPSAFSPYRCVIVDVRVVVVWGEAMACIDVHIVSFIRDHVHSQNVREKGKDFSLGGGGSA